MHRLEIEVDGEEVSQLVHLFARYEPFIVVKTNADVHTSVSLHFMSSSFHVRNKTPTCL